MTISEEMVRKTVLAMVVAMVLAGLFSSKSATLPAPARTGLSPGKEAC